MLFRSQPAGAAVLAALTSDAAGKVNGSVDVARQIAASAPSAGDQLPSLLFKA